MSSDQDNFFFLFLFQAKIQYCYLFIIFVSFSSFFFHFAIKRNFQFPFYLGKMLFVVDLYLYFNYIIWTGRWKQMVPHDLVVIYLDKILLI